MTAATLGRAMADVTGEGVPSAGERTARFTLAIFGRVRILDTVRGGEVDIRSRKACAALAFAALSRTGSVTRDRLAALLWGDRGEEQARASLRQMISELRASELGQAGALKADRRDFGVDQAAVESELDRLLGLAAAGRMDALAAALDRLDGGLLEGLDGVSEALDDWLRIERTRLLDRLLDGVVGRCGEGSDLAACRQVIAALQRLSPGDESLARMGLELESRAGDLAALHRRYRLLETSLREDFDSAPSQQTQELFRRLTMVKPVGTPASIAATSQVSAVAPPRLEPPVVVVLPIEMAGASAEDALLAQVCAGEVEAALGSIAGLRVLSPPVGRVDALEAARSASLSTYSLRGSMRPAGARLHVSWRLTRLTDGMIVWSRKSLVERLKLQEAMDEVVARAAGAVLPALERDLGRHAAEAPQVDPSAYELYLRGRARSLGAVTLEDAEAAAALFEQAIACDPNLVNAYLSLARLYNTDYCQKIAGHDRAPLRARAFELYTRAVALSPTSAQAHAFLGWCYLRRGDLGPARAKFGEAMELSANHADCLNELGVAYGHLGDLDRAEELIRRAFDLNPFPPDDYFCDLGVVLMQRGDHDAAEQQFEVAQMLSLPYRAHRLANLALTGRDADLSRGADDLRGGFGAIWRGAGRPSDRDLVLAMLEYIPIRYAAGIDMFNRGLQRAGMAV